MIEIARAVAAANGMADRIVFVSGLSQAVTLPERANVLIGELLGHSGLEESILGFFLDAQQRFLAKGGLTIPRRLEIHVAPVEVPEIHAKLIGAWDRAYDIDFIPVRRWAAQQTYAIEFKTSDLRSDAVGLATLDLTSVDKSFVHGGVSFDFSQETVVHGFALWFRVELIDGVSLTNAPPLRTPNWRHLFLPLEHPLSVGEKDRIEVTISTFDGLVWRWQGRTLVGDESHMGSSFDHSTFGGFPREPRKADNAVNVSASSTRSDAAMRALAGLRDGLSVEAIASAIQGQFPGAFPTPWAADHFVKRILALL
jgi:hypothetical protein